MASGSIQHHLREAAQARQSGRAADARRNLEAVLALDPDQPMARNALGLEALSEGDAKAAIEHFSRACRADSDAPELQVNLATAHSLGADHEAARAALEKALATDQRYLPALIRLAQLHERLGEEGPAARRWSEVLTLAASFGTALPDLAQILAHARSYVERSRRELADALDQALRDQLAGAPARDRRRARAAADAMLGRRRIYANQCHGLHYPFLPADEFFDREHFHWLERLEAATHEIRSEVQAILADPKPGLAPYIEQPSGVPQNIWSPLNRSLDWGALHLWRDGERIDQTCARAPRTAALVDTLPLCRIPRRAPAVFFSVLKAGAHIPPHSGVTNVRSIVHLPLIVPAGCTFRVGGETRQWREGEAFVFDDTIEHEAHNSSEQDRVVLILDCWNPYLSEGEQEMIRRIYEVRDTQGISGDFADTSA